MSKRLIIEYEGTEALSITLMESAMRNIHESPNGKLISLNNEEGRSHAKADLDIIFGSSSSAGN